LPVDGGFTAHLGSAERRSMSVGAENALLRILPQPILPFSAGDNCLLGVEHR